MVIIQGHTTCKNKVKKKYTTLITFFSESRLSNLAKRLVVYHCLPIWSSTIIQNVHRNTLINDNHEDGIKIMFILSIGKKRLNLHG